MSIPARERLLNFFIFIGVLALIFVVGYPQYKASQPSKVRIGVDKSYGSLPFYFAKLDTTRRYFRLEKVEPLFVDMSDNPLQDLAEDKYDIAAIPWYQLIVSPVVDGDTLKVFGSVELKSGKNIDAIVLPPKSHIKGIKDLRGKRIGFLYEDEYLVDLILENLKQDKITNIDKIPLRQEEITTAFSDKRVDALLLLDPFRGFKVYEGNVIFFPGIISAYIVPSLPYKAIVMKKNFVKENRQAAIRVKNAIDAAMVHIERNPEVGKRMLVGVNGWPPDSLSLFNLRTPEYQRMAEINLKTVEKFQTELVKRGIAICGLKPIEFVFEKTTFVRR